MDVGALMGSMTSCMCETPAVMSMIAGVETGDLTTPGADELESLCSSASCSGLLGALTAGMDVCSGLSGSFGHDDDERDQQRLTQCMHARTCMHRGHETTRALCAVQMSITRRWYCIQQPSPAALTTLPIRRCACPHAHAHAYTYAHADLYTCTCTRIGLHDDIPGSQRATVKSGIAKAAQVRSSQVTVTYVAGSVEIYAIISVPDGTNPTDISSNLNDNLGTNAAASSRYSSAAPDRRIP